MGQFYGFSPNKAGGGYETASQGCSGERKPPPRPQRTIGYLRVSTSDQDLEKNKADILAFANERRLGNVDWVEEKVPGMKSWRNREIARAVDPLDTGDWLIVPELSRLGR